MKDWSKIKAMSYTMPSDIVFRIFVLKRCIFWFPILFLLFILILLIFLFLLIKNYRIKIYFKLISIILCQQVLMILNRLVGRRIRDRVRVGCLFVCAFSIFLQHFLMINLSFKFTDFFESIQNSLLPRILHALIQFLGKASSNRWSSLVDRGQLWKRIAREVWWIFTYRGDHSRNTSWQSLMSLFHLDERALINDVALD